MGGCEAEPRSVSPRTAELRGILAFDLNRPVLQNDGCVASIREPFRDIVTFGVNRQIYESRRRAR